MEPAHDPALRLHPSVEVTPLAAGFELHDRRTAFRLALDDAPPLRAGDPLPDGLCDLLGSLGLLDENLPDVEVRRRQGRFANEQSWPERLERFRDLLTFARTRVPFYARQAALYDPERLDSRDSLNALPRLDRRTVRAAFMELCDRELDVKAAMRSGRLELASTSGSTDERLQVLTDASLVRIPAEFRAIFALGPSAAPPGESPRTAVFTSRTCLSEQCRLEASPLASRIVHDYTLFLPAPHDPFRLEADEVRQISDELHQFRPAFFFVNPVYAHLLARRAAELDVRLPSVALTLSCYQYASKFQRRALERHFGAAVRNLYAATELGGCQVGLECHRGELHLREDHCLVELMVGERDAEADEPGAVIVSTLAGRTMPLIRYELGDLAAPRDERCDCPLADWPVMTFHGRTAEALFVDRRWMTTRDIDEAMPTDAGIDFYCCRQTATREFSIEVVPALGASFRPSLLRERLQDLFGGGEFRINEVRALSPLPSLKYPLTKREITAPPFGGLDAARA